MYTAMPRIARIDTPGLLHHVMLRGIERRKIFNDDKDRENFIERLSILLSETKTQCYAWSFLSNVTVHLHPIFVRFALLRYREYTSEGETNKSRAHLNGYSYELRVVYCLW